MKNILIITGSNAEASQYKKIAAILAKSDINVHFTCTREHVYHYLKDKWPNTIFINNPPFYKDHNIDLSNYLLKYVNPTISEILFSDHVVKKWDNHKKIIRVTGLIDFYEEYFNKNNIQGILSFPSSSIIARTAFTVARSRGIKISIINTGPIISNSSVISNSEKNNSWPEFENLYNQLNNLSIDEKNEVDKRIKAVIDDKKRSALIRKPSYLRIFYNLFRFIFTSIFIRYDEYEKFEIKKEIDFLTGFLPFRYYFFDKVPEGDFIFFPIHLPYDAQICVRNPMFYDQETIIQNLSDAAPPNCSIVVKAHPYNSGRVIEKTYKLCKKLKNVKIVNTGISSFELIKKSKITSVINSTGGLEAIILKKPLLVFGNAYFQHYKNAININDINSLPSILNNLFLDQPEDKSFDDEYYKFLFSIFKTSKKGSFNFYKNYMNLGKNQNEEHINNLSKIVKDHFI